MLKKILTISLVCLAVCRLSADSISIVRPRNNGVVANLNAAQHFYARQTAEEVRALFLAEPLFCDELHHTVGNVPQGVEMQWSFKGARSKIHYELKYADNPELVNAKVLQPPHSQFFLQNLEINRKYYWQVSAVYNDGTRIDTPVQSFTVENLPPRVMNVPNVANFRDLGGKVGLDGRVSAQGLIYRSTGLNDNSGDGGKTPGKPRFTEEGRRIMLEDLKLKTELDLRAQVETAGMTDSPLGSEVNYINISSCCYGAVYAEEGCKNYAKLFRIFCNPDNYPINFHCIAGADRTGSLGFLLGALLGYSERDLIIDYTFTTFMATRDVVMFDMLYRPLQAFGSPNDSLAAKAERYFLKAGILPEEIQAFRDIMLGPGTTLAQSSQKYLDGLRKMASAQPSDGALALCYQKTDMVTGKLCGHDYDVLKYARSDSGIRSASDGNGGYIFLPPICNPEDALPLVLVADPEKLTAPSYTITSPTENLAYAHDGGKTGWTAEELNSFLCRIPSEIFLLEVKPGEDVDESWTIVENLLTTDYPVMTAILTAVEPQLDGDLNEEIWNQAVFRNMNDSDNAAELPQVAVAFNPDCSMLYLAARIPDYELFWTGEGPDSAPYDGDSVEIFLTAMGHDEYYQFVFNGQGGSYDSKIMDGKWNAKDVRFATKCNEDGWTLEAAIPLEQLNFDAPLELNICCSDYDPYGHRTLYSLWPTNGSFHNRTVMRPVKVRK